MANFQFWIPDKERDRYIEDIKLLRWHFDRVVNSPFYKSLPVFGEFKPYDWAYLLGGTKGHRRKRVKPTKINDSFVIHQAISLLAFDIRTDMEKAKMERVRSIVASHIRAVQSEH